MSQTWMMTAPRNKISKREIRILMEMSDVKDYTIAIEKGKNGYEHFQCRFTASDPDLFERWTALEPWIHLEKAQTKDDTYERKENRFWSSRDTVEVRIQRFGKLRPHQQNIMDVVYKSNDREVVVWYDTEGNIGKSWLCGHLWETGQAHMCQAQNQVKGMIQDIASDYIDNGFRPIVVIDIPRTWKWTTDLYCAIERIKDGLIKDTRYGARTINIHGVKVLVLCNSLPKLDKLSMDRWIIIEHTRHRGTLFVTLSGA